MRTVLAAAVAACFAVSAVSQDDPFLKGEELQAEIAKSCVDGCVTFSREEAAIFQAQLDGLLARKQEEAFKAGRQYERISCRNAI